MRFGVSVCTRRFRERSPNGITGVKIRGEGQVFRIAPVSEVEVTYRTTSNSC